MANFLVERYWPGVTTVAAEAVTASLADRGLEIVETIVTGPDEVCFWYVKAASLRAVETAFAAASIPIDRIARATAVRGRPTRSSGR